MKYLKLFELREWSPIQHRFELNEVVYHKNDLYTAYRVIDRSYLGKYIRVMNKKTKVPATGFEDVNDYLSKIDRDIELLNIDAKKYNL